MFISHFHWFCQPLSGAGSGSGGSSGGGPGDSGSQSGTKNVVQKSACGAKIVGHWRNQKTNYTLEPIGGPLAVE